MKLKTWMKSALAVGALMSLSTGVFADGMLRYATVGEPPSLDQQVITSDLATTIAHHMFEGLYTLTKDFLCQKVPTLKGAFIIINLIKMKTWKNILNHLEELEKQGLTKEAVAFKKEKGIMELWENDNFIYNNIEDYENEQRNFLANIKKDI